MADVLTTAVSMTGAGNLINNLFLWYSFFLFFALFFQWKSIDTSYIH